MVRYSVVCYHTAINGWHSNQHVRDWAIETTCTFAHDMMRQYSSEKRKPGSRSKWKLCFSPMIHHDTPSQVVATGDWSLLWAIANTKCLREFFCTSLYKTWEDVLIMKDFYKFKKHVPSKVKGSLRINRAPLSPTWQPLPTEARNLATKGKLWRKHWTSPTNNYLSWRTHLLITEADMTKVANVSFGESDQSFQAGMLLIIIIAKVGTFLSRLQYTIILCQTYCPSVPICHCCRRFPRYQGREIPCKEWC